MNQEHWRCAGSDTRAARFPASSRSGPATMQHEAGDRIRVQTNQPVRQHKSLYSGVISQPDVFALHAKNQLVGNPPYSILPYVRNETPSVYDP
jgi:PhoPQ-activated pathogenicity-related protein